jgi:UDP-glucose 4-epimerase
MKILVTGGAGFVASHVVDHLIARGDQVTVVDDLRTGKRENVNAGASFFSEDIRSQSDVTGYDAIIHAAAYADLRHNWESEAQRARLYADNVDVTRHMLERFNAPRFLFLSTASVYGAAKHDHPVYEIDAGPHTCESPYAASKLACEAMIAAYAFARGFRWKVGRLVNVVGARTQHGVIGDFVRMHRRLWCTEHRKYVEDGYCRECNGDRNCMTGHIHAADNGKQRKSWVHVADVADAFLRMIDDDVPDGIYSVTSDERISWWDVVDAMGVSRDLVTFEDRAGGAIGDPIDLHVSGEKLGRHYRPCRPVSDGIKDALKHLGWP